MKKPLFLVIFIALMAFATLAECQTRISVFLLKPAGGKEAEEISKAIHDIMLSQLLEKNQIIPIPNQYIPTDDKDAAAKALKDDSDYLVAGGIAMLGKSSNLSIRLIDTKTSTPVQAYSKLADKQEDIPGVLAEISKSIKASISASNTDTKPQAIEPAPIAPIPAPQSVQPKPGIGMDNDQKLIQQDSKADQALIDPINKNLIFKTPTIEERIISLAKSGTDSIIGLTRNNIIIFKKYKNNLNISGEPESQPGQQNLRIDSTDQDGNGQDEIYITHINTHFNTPVTRMYSLEKDKLNLKQSEPGFFSSTAYRNCKKIALIQKEGRGNALYSGDIYQVSAKGLNDRSLLKVPSGVFLDNFMSGKITEKQNEMWLRYDNENKMILMDDKGEEEWEGDEKFGGSMESMEKQMEAARKDDTERKFFKQRLIGFCDDSGRTYILTVKNEDMAKGLLSGFRKFTSGKAIIYGWSGIGLKEIWSSESIPGGIHDIELFDADGDGKKDIIFAASIESTFKSKGYIGGLRLPEKISVLLK